MRRRTVVFDVETAPNPALDDLAVESAKQRAEARRNDDPESVDLEAVRHEMALSPVFGRIVAVGLLDADGDAPLLWVGQDEGELLDLFWHNVQGYNLFIGFNSLTFDLPWLVLRSSLNGIHPAVRISQARYRAPGGSNHLDLYAWLTDWRGNRTKHLKLDLPTVARALGVEPPDGDSARVPALFEGGDFEAVRAHLEGDLRATWQVWQRLGYPGAPVEYGHGRGGRVRAADGASGAGRSNADRIQAGSHGESTERDAS